MPLGGGGYLVLKRPWPGMLRGIYGDPERYRETYWSRFPGMYFAGDGAKRDEEGYFWLLGRVDDVMNVAGHRISTIEVESALVDHRSVAEAAVVGKNDRDHRPGDLRLRHPQVGQEPSDTLAIELREHVAYVIGPIARPKFLMFVPDLPKTRSGKIMRRLLRDIAEGRTLGDTTTLADATVVETIRSEHRQGRGGVTSAVRLPEARTGTRAATRDAARAAIAGRTCAPAVRGVPFDGAHRGLALHRPDGRRSGRLSDALNKREAIAITDVYWAPVDGSAPLAGAAPGLKTVDPYDLIMVIGGEDTLPPLTDDRARRAQVHKVAYDVALEVPPFRVDRDRVPASGVGAGAAAGPVERDVRAGRRGAAPWAISRSRPERSRPSSSTASTCGASSRWTAGQANAPSRSPASRRAAPVVR